MIERVVFVEVSSCTVTKLLPVTLLVMNEFIDWFVRSEGTLTTMVCELCVSRIEEIEKLQSVGSFATSSSSDFFRFTKRSRFADNNNITIVGIKVSNYGLNNVLTINSNCSVSCGSFIQSNSSTSFMLECYLFPLDLNDLYAPLPIDVGFMIKSGTSVNSGSSDCRAIASHVMDAL